MPGFQPSGYSFRLDLGLRPRLVYDAPLALDFLQERLALGLLLEKLALDFLQERLALDFLSKEAARSLLWSVF